ncbi:NAD-dependent epimerase/dehydratase family protein [Anaerorudis cellulosivorans]|jgi:UDP-glucose 4-epimerase|uniref:NAD-dependent epimerase/dehydratase family protein n=1 Tax=Anaerorudis cellulosivorans TaxID=3397862 RepID=UPI002220A2E4|nr:NAD(P)-dependent oxidoreductase [Seramator thermalis]MCW1734239.1 NAD(P)-dependent oxidoreductase [Seramator thermalis]
MHKTEILIIGATGSTGLYLTDYLSNKNYNIVATGFKERNSDYFKNKGINYLQLDISKKESFKKIPKNNFNCVVLLAGMMPARMSGYNPYKYIDINITGTLNVLEYCRENNINKIIFALSHSDVAGYWNTGIYIKDDVVRKPILKGDHAAYIISKIAAADLTEYYHQEYGIQNIIFRMPTIYCYWPDDTMYVNGLKTKMAYLTFIEKAQRGETIEIWGDPTIKKDIVYIKDFIQLIEKAILNPTAHGIYNVGSGTPISLEEQIKGIVEAFGKPGKKSPIIYRPDKPSQISYLYDITKAKKELGYKVKYPYKIMLEDMKKEMNNPMFKIIMNNND